LICDIHVGNVLKLCSQRIYLLKLLRDQGLSRFHLNTIFDALVLSRLRYAISAWSGFLSAELKGNINYGRTLSDTSMLYFADVFLYFFYGRLSWPNG